MVITSKKGDPFARVPKTILNNPALSWKAKGVLAYLLGKPDGWTAQVTDICNKGSDKECAVRSALKELRGTGYADLLGMRNGGKITKWVLRVSDSPIFSKSPDRDFPDVEKPDVENRHLSKKEGIENEKSKNDPKQTARELAERIYSVYPKKAGHPKAITAITRRLGAKNKNFDAMLKATKVFSELWSGVKGEPFRFCPHPATWFNQERYSDDPETWARPHDDKKPDWRNLEKRSNVKFMGRFDQDNAPTSDDFKGLSKSDVQKILNGYQDWLVKNGHAEERY